MFSFQKDQSLISGPSIKAWLFVMLAGIVVVVLCVLVGKYFFFSKKTLPVPPMDALYRQSTAPIAERVEDLLSRMTLEEKIGQMALVEKNSVVEKSDIAEYGIGALLSGGGAKPAQNTIEGWYTMIIDFVGASRQSRLSIPILYGVDANHGHSNVPGATVFPHFIGLGATGDVELVEEVARATARELKATGVNWSYSPTLDTPQDIRWGRVYETFSDDPKLTGALGAAYVRGLQKEYPEGTSSSSIFVLSTPKHYIGAGGMQWGSASNENFRIDQGTTPVDETMLRETYLLPFREAVDAGALSVMVGLNSWGDTKLAANKYLVTDVLKGDLGFKGFAVSDWYGVYEIPGGDYRAAVTAINAGIDMVMLPFDYEAFIKNVVRAVRKGEIAEGRIDDAVRRILRAKFSLGLFDVKDAKLLMSDMVGGEAHRQLAREAVAASLVLLKNKDSVVPLSQGVRHIRVAGSAADNVGRQSGAWTVEWQGIDGNWLPGGTSILAGIRNSAGSAEVEYDLEARFSSSSKKAHVGIAVVGEVPYAEGWGDTENPELSTADKETIARLKEVSEKVVVVIVSGRPLIITDEIPSWDAAVAAWLPGSEGAGVADVLFGDKAFRGKLPLPWPARISQLPISPSGKTQDGSVSLFPRSFGLK